MRVADLMHLDPYPSAEARGGAWSPRLDVAVGPDAVRRYEAALARLRRRDQRAVRGRIELQWSYIALAAPLGVQTAAAARSVVVRALERLVEAMTE
jgi:hypothetical protein